MDQTIKFKIDGKILTAQKGQTIVEAATDNGVYIPTLCNFPGVKPKGCCRMCTIKINNRYMTACTTPVARIFSVNFDNSSPGSLRKGQRERLTFTSMIITRFPSPHRWGPAVA